MRKLKLQGESPCGLVSCTQLSGTPAQTPDMWKRKASGDSAPRHSGHSQLFEFSQVRPQTLWNRAMPTPLYPD